jgi:SAM-dependent methyltransferase
MTRPFAAYAGYYDLVYGAKPYESECDYLEDVFGRFAPARPGTLLDIGCGTGGHALRLAARGFQVTGVDRSEEMIRAAEAKAEAASPRPRFVVSDVRALDLGARFDAAIAMFAVVSYLVEDADLQAAFGALRRHLSAGGLFVFDGWFGPGVLADPPGDRVHEVATPEGKVVRFARATTDLRQQRTDVHYRLLHLLDGRVLAEVEETHAMRFFFPAELDLLLARAGFRLTHLCGFPSLDADVTPKTWIFGAVAEAV